MLTPGMRMLNVVDFCNAVKISRRFPRLSLEAAFVRPSKNSMP